MTQPTFQERVQSLFHRVLALPSEAREAFLSSAGDPEAAAEVRSLLAHSGDPSVLGLVTGGLSVQVLEWRPGDRIGRFQVVRLIGSGASGDVFLARQEDPARDVALKVLREGAADETRERFRMEGEVLARLSHENIARVYEVGEHEGRRYLALELVPGLPITAHADRERMSVAARIELVIGLCEALEHIHQNGLIHRDLKPGNIVVVAGPRGPVPKVIDFGIAKSLDAVWGAGRTVEGTALGTIEYASPEQLRDGRSVDTRTDLYAIGVILYELLTGTRPHRMAERGLAAFLSALEREEAPLPSATLAAAPDLESIATSRGTTPVRLLQELRSDLDWIVAKALRKVPGERYSSAGALRNDLLRYLRGEPVDAHPPTVTYRLRKSVRRHRVALATTVVVLAVAVVGLVATARQARIAKTHLRELESLTTSLVSSVNEIVDIPGAIDAKQRLVAAATQTLESIAERRTDPEFRARLADAYERVGQLRADPYTASLGQTEQGGADLLRAAMIRRELYEQSPGPGTAARLMRSSHALILIEQSGWPGGPNPDSVLHAAMEVGNRYVGVDTAYDVRSELAMLHDLQAEYEVSHAQWGKVLDLLQRAYALRREMARLRPDSDESQRWIAQSRERLAYAAQDAGEAREHALAAYALMQPYAAARGFSYRALLDLSFTCRNTAYALQRSGSIDSAVTLYRRALAIRRTMAASDARDFRSRRQLNVAMTWLAMGFIAANRPDSALYYARRALEQGERLVATPGAPRWAADDLPYLRSIVARSLVHANRFAEADSFYANADSTWSFGDALSLLQRWRLCVEHAHACRRAGHAAAAESCLTRASRLVERIHGMLVEAGADATPCADVALATIHLAQMRRISPEERVRMLERAASLPSLEEHPRQVRLLLMNELACAHAQQGTVTEARKLLHDALGRSPASDLRATLSANLAMLDRTPQARYRALPHDPAHDPYARLDRVVFRMIPVWGELPVPPATRLAPAGLETAAQPGEAQPRVAAHRALRDAER